MMTGLRFTMAALAFFGALSQSSAANQKGYKTTSSVMICDKSDESAICLNEPMDAPQAVILRDDTTAADVKAAPSMLTLNELSGGALSVENEALMALAVDPLDLELRPENALTNAQQANEKLRSVEQYLKTASQAAEDGIVRGAGQKK